MTFDKKNVQKLTEFGRDASWPGCAHYFDNNNILTKIL